MKVTLVDKPDLTYINSPIEQEVEVLRILNGESVPGWTAGAAINACCENLKSMGLAKGMYEITDKGKEYLRSKGHIMHPE
jgi:hypothetical protein